MTREDTRRIKSAMALAGITNASIARRIGCKKEQVSAVLNGRRATPYIRRAIAQACRSQYVLLWGESDPGIDRHPPGGRSVHTVTESSPDRAGDVDGSGR